MDLSKTIAELEKQAAQYTAAANSLRALSSGTSAGSAAGTAAVVAAATAPTGAKRGRKPGRPAGSKAAAPKAPKAAKTASGKRYVSQVTRDKIAAAIKARHAEKRKAREGG